MGFETLISAEDLAALMASETPVHIFDCSFELGDPEAGRAAYLAGHISGARYLHLDDDLAAPPSGKNGRHPLPTREDFAALLRSHGVNAGEQVVVYDGAGGAFAARAWWMLRWIGHAAVAVLDGGRKAWEKAGQPYEAGEPVAAPPGSLELGPSLVGEPVAVEDVVANLDGGTSLVVDARDPGRFRGDPSPLDPVSGHIPGAANRFFRDNLADDGSFRSSRELRAAFAQTLGETAPEAAILQCGSGVTACHNALAMEIAGLSGARLYPGSWSEWVADEARPVETGGG